jgi:glutathione S-transferase
MHFNNNVQGMFFAKLAARAAQSEGGPVEGVIERRENGYYRYLDQQLGRHAYVAGPDFSCADIMVTFNLTSLSRFGGRPIDDLPNVLSYVARITQRPAYVKALQIAGPAAAKPKP